MVNLFKIQELIEDDLEDNFEEKENTDVKNNNKEKLTSSNLKNQIIGIIHNIIYGNDLNLTKHEIDNMVHQYLTDIKKLKDNNHHFNHYVIQSLFRVLYKCKDRHNFIAKSLQEYNLMCYGAKTLGDMFDRYWDKETIKYTDSKVIAGIVAIWEEYNEISRKNNT